MSEQEAVYDICFPNTESSEPLEALCGHLESGVEPDVDVRRSSRQRGASDELGVMEVIVVASVVVNGLSLLVNTVRLIRDWQMSRKREGRKNWLVTIEDDECKIDIYAK